MRRNVGARKIYVRPGWKIGKGRNSSAKRYRDREINSRLLFGAAVIYSGIKMPGRDNVEVERPAKGNARVRHAYRKDAYRVVQRVRVIGEKVKRTRDESRIRDLSRPVTHPTECGHTSSRGERERKMERKKDADETRTSKHVLRWCIRHHKTGALDFTACRARTSTSADKIKFSRNERTDVWNRNRLGNDAYPRAERV